MKFKIWILLVISMLSGCGGDQQDDSGFFSDYIIENASNYRLEVEYSFSHEENPSVERFEIEAGSSNLFYSDFELAHDIANAPSPATTFSVVRVYLLNNDERISSSEIIDESKWVLDRQGELSVYTLTLVDNDFTF